MKEKRVYLGSFGVDSGQVLICDPCYIDSEWEKGDKTKEDSFSYDGCGNKSSAHGGELRFKMGHLGAGVVSSTGFGDGTYEVWAIIQDYELWGERVKRLEIIFDEDDDGAN